MQNPTYPVGAAGNALRTVALLHESGELRVAQVADHLEVARSTAHRLLAMLVFHGFAEQDRRKMYVPGPALRAISGSAPPRIELVPARCRPKPAQPPPGRRSAAAARTSPQQGRSTIANSS